MQMKLHSLTCHSPPAKPQFLTGHGPVAVQAQGVGDFPFMLQDVAANEVAFSSVAPACFQRNDLQPTLASYLTSP